MMLPAMDSVKTGTDEILNPTVGSSLDEVSVDKYILTKIF
jgi:hypothetical protein